MHADVSLLDEAINLATARTPDIVEREHVAVTADALLTVLFDNDVVRQLGMVRPCPNLQFGETEHVCQGCRGAMVLPVTGDFLRAALRLESRDG